MRSVDNVLVFRTKGVFLWGDLDLDQWCKITLILVFERNWLIHSGCGFIDSFHAPWSGSTLAQINPGAAKELINPFWLWIHWFFFNTPWLGVILAQILVFQRNWLIHSGYGFISFFLFSCTMMGSDLGHPLYPLPWGAYYKVETLLKDECLFWGFATFSVILMKRDTTNYHVFEERPETILRFWKV